MAAAVVRRLQPLRPAWYMYQSSRGMATLKELSIRIKSVTNTAKITKSMKMVSASKFKIAEKELKPARVYGNGAKALFESAEVDDAERKSKHLIVAISSDRGLCGSIHSGISRNIRTLMEERPAGSNTMIVCVGDKMRTLMQRFFRESVLMHFQDVGRKPPMFTEASFIAQEILNSGFEYDTAELIYNRFRNVISFRLTSLPLVPFSTLVQSEKLLLYDDVDEDTLRCFHEIALANLIYFAMKENAASEQSSRMTAMDAATKNAGDMIDALTLKYNRTRQAVITRELIEIISGAAAV